MKNHYIYFCESRWLNEVAGTPIFKVGYSENPTVRMLQLKTLYGLPEEPSLLSTIEVNIPWLDISVHKALQTAGFRRVRFNDKRTTTQRTVKINTNSAIEWFAGDWKRAYEVAGQHLRVLNTLTELIELYSTPVLIGETKPSAQSRIAAAAAEEERVKMSRRHKPKKNEYTALLDLFNTPVPIRREEEVETNFEEEKTMTKCALCGKQLDIYECPECGRPLVDGNVCSACKIKCRNYEDAIKLSYPSSIRYYPFTGELEDEEDAKRSER